MLFFQNLTPKWEFAQNFTPRPDLGFLKKYPILKIHTLNAIPELPFQSKKQPLFPIFLVMLELAQFPVTVLGGPPSASGPGSIQASSRGGGHNLIAVNHG